jgi:hypothetical protein
MQREKLIWLAFLGFVVLLAVIGFIFRQAVREVLIDPLFQAYWRLRLYWMGLDPDMVWGLFIMVFILLVLNVLPSFQRRDESKVLRNIRPGLRVSGPDPNNPPESVEGRLGFWLNEVHQMFGERYFARLTMVELKKLILDYLALRERFPTRIQAERWLRENTPPAQAEPQVGSRRSLGNLAGSQDENHYPGDYIPAQVRQLFIPRPTVKPGKWEKRLGWFTRWFTPTQQNPPSTTARDLEDIIQFLEQEPGKKS